MKIELTSQSLLDASVAWVKRIVKRTCSSAKRTSQEGCCSSTPRNHQLLHLPPPLIVDILCHVSEPKAMLSTCKTLWSLGQDSYVRLCWLTHRASCLQFIQMNDEGYYGLSSSSTGGDNLASIPPLLLEWGLRFHILSVSAYEGVVTRHRGGQGVHRIRPHIALDIELAHASPEWILYAWKHGLICDPIAFLSLLAQGLGRDEVAASLQSCCLGNGL